MGIYESMVEADESLVIAKVKKKPTAIIDSDSDSEEDWKDNQNVLKEQKKTEKASIIYTSSDDDDTDFTVC